MPRKKSDKGKRGKAEAVPDSPPARVRLPWGQFVRVAAGLLIAISLVAGIAWVGRLVGHQLVGEERYSVRVSDIDCPTPPGVDRALFLTEVRYMARLPATVPAIDPELPETLRAAFAAHPWVASVDAVEPTPGGLRVGLTFREPILVVPVAGADGPRVVDPAGVLLPPTAPTAGLATLAHEVPPPTEGAGRPWPDPDVTRAAELASTHRPARLIEKGLRAWRVTRADGTVLRVGW